MIKFTLAAAVAAAMLGTAAHAQGRTVGNTPAAISDALVRFGYAPQFREREREVLRTVVEACRGRDKFRVSVNLLGAVSTKERLGRCDIPGARAAAPAPAPSPQGLDQNALVENLRAKGYTQIALIERRRRQIVFRACNGSQERVEVAIDRRGNLERLRDLGDCRGKPRRVNQADVRKDLRDKGYNRIRFETERAPFGVVACLNDVRERLIVNRRGRVIERNRAGNCGPRATIESVQKSLQEQGFKRVSVRADGRRFAADACKGTAKLALRINRRGEIFDQSRNGRCASRDVSAVLDRLNKRGGRKLELFVEGCFDGSRYRWSFDELGDRTGRRRIGAC